MGDYVQPLESVVSGFENPDTEKMLGFIEELHGLGVSKYIDLPQLVAVGDQSSGKSSVLQAITRLPFPVSDTLCTRFATEVALHRSVGQKSMFFSIKLDNQGSPGLTDERRQMLLNWSEEVDDIDNMDYSEFSQVFADLLSKASNLILGENSDLRNCKSLSHATLHINVKGPREANLTIVDIPGLPSAGHEVYKTARALVNKYLNNPKSIILAVAHPSDPGTQEIFQILNNVSQKESRVIGVITKCDRKQEGAENWVFDTIRNDRRRNPHYLTQGWFGLRNRLPIEANTGNDERDHKENLFFQQGAWQELNRPNRLGISNLRQALSKMHNNHLMSSIPELIPEIELRLAICNSELGKLGHPRSTKASQLDCMVALASKFEKLSTYALDGRYEKLPEDPELKVRKIVHEALERFTHELDGYTWCAGGYFGDSRENGVELDTLEEELWEDQILDDSRFSEIGEVIRQNRGKEPPGEVNPCVMGILWNRRTQGWEDFAVKLIDELVRSIGVAVGGIFKNICPDEELRNNTRQWLSEHLDSIYASARAELEKIVSDENNGFLWTNQDRLSLIHKFANERIRSMSDRLWEPYVTANRDASRLSLERKIKAWIGKRSNISAIFKTYDLILSYYLVALNRFIDNIGHQVVERHLLGPTSPLRIFQPEYIVRTLQEDDELLRKIAGENENKVAERAALNAEKVSLEKALSTARTYGYGLN